MCEGTFSVPPHQSATSEGQEFTPRRAMPGTRPYWLRTEGLCLKKNPAEFKDEGLIRLQNFFVFHMGLYPLCGECRTE